jgi:hypothetical protein
MFGKFLPESIDNNYRGHRAAPWILWVIVAIRTIQSVNTMFNGYSIAKGDGIPMDTFSADAVETIVSILALSAFYRLILTLMCVLVLVRYRKAIPFMFAVLGVHYLGAELIQWLRPPAGIETAVGPVISAVMLGLIAAGMVLSLRTRRNRA